MFLSACSLEKLSFSADNLSKFVLRTPRGFLGLNPFKIEEISIKVENNLGIPRKTSMYLHGFTVMSTIRQSTFDTKWEILKSFGWSHADIGIMFRKLPYLLRVSEAKMRKLLDFLMKELGYSPGYLASRPKFFFFKFGRSCQAKD
ncbi:hypothetical protein ACH5RR_026748 [Cinchona calisaya]|uniref:Uncharacterized protein n=1 Tax=Cinchona calisaya TaxID=153742 RepID=A0ABD2Z5C6_9GENT